MDNEFFKVDMFNHIIGATFSKCNKYRYVLYKILIAGPITFAPRPLIEKQGFQGFRYTTKLF